MSHIYYPLLYGSIVSYRQAYHKSPLVLTLTLLNRIREELYEGLKDRKNLSLREKQFLERYEKSVLTESEDANDEEEKRCAG